MKQNLSILRGTKGLVYFTDPSWPEHLYNIHSLITEVGWNVVKDEENENNIISFFIV